MVKEADGLFKPDMEYNRQNFLTSVLKMVGMKESAYKNTFAESARMLKESDVSNLAQDNSFRKEARKKVELITNGDENTRRRLFNSMKNIKPEYLL